MLQNRVRLSDLVLADVCELGERAVCAIATRNPCARFRANGFLVPSATFFAALSASFSLSALSLSRQLAQLAPFPLFGNKRRAKHRSFF